MFFKLLIYQLLIKYLIKYQFNNSYNIYNFSKFIFKLLKILYKVVNSQK